MRLINFSIFISVLLLAACSSSREAAGSDDPPPPASVQPQESDAEDPDVVLPASSEAMMNAQPWSPHFIPTGFASGIMIEFTGMKPEAKLNAKYAGIELQRSVSDSALPSTLTLTSSINDLRQAFFKVRPGVYLFRQTRGWAEPTYLRSVEVRQGSYSVVTVQVLNPRSQSIRPASDTNDH